MLMLLPSTFSIITLLGSCPLHQYATIPPFHHSTTHHRTILVAMFWLMCLARGKDHGAPEPHVADGRHMSTRLRQFKVWHRGDYSATLTPNTISHPCIISLGNGRPVI